MDPIITMNDGCRIPQLGLGVWQVSTEEIEAVVAHALQSGYRHIDTAAAYGNEDGVGAAVRDSGRDRTELFITTKLWNSDQGRASARTACERSRQKLGGGPIDLYLIHWPAPAADRYLDSWRTLIELQGEGMVRSIGVSNFRVQDLQRLIDETGVVPAVNQIELHPRFQQADLRRFHAEHDILTEAWSPLGSGRSLTDPTIGQIAGACHRTPAQVILRWHLQLGNVVIPKSVTPSRIEENFELFGFSLSGEQMSAIEALDQGAQERIGPDPATFSLGI